jgi:hypothetical protein
MIDSEHREQEDETNQPSETHEPREEEVEHNLPGTPDENAVGLVDGVAEGE